MTGGVSPVVQQLPKIELHLHLDISMSYRVASALVPGLTSDAYERSFQGPSRVEDLTAFLSTTRTQVALLQSRRALARLTDDVIRTLATEGVIYAELRFAPLLHTEEGLTPEEVIETVLEAAGSASRRTGTGIGIILTSLRHFTAAESLRTARLASRFHGHGVAAFDLGGDETAALAPHLPAFEHVREADVPFTVHAGEGRGPESIREVVQALAPRRLGHGVRATEDPVLLDELIATGMHFEVCPSCNVQLGLFSSVGAHPLGLMLARGASLSVSTDSRTSTVTTLTRELERCRAAHGWGTQELIDVSVMAARAAFVGPELRARLIERIRGYERQHGGLEITPSAPPVQP